jgi:hypothetical protein
MSKMIFKKLKKYHWHAFQHEKLFKKQLLSHCQTYLCNSYKRNKHTRSRFLNAEDAGKQMSLQEGIASERSLIRRHVNNCED